MRIISTLVIIGAFISSCNETKTDNNKAFPMQIENLDPERPLSAAMQRSFHKYEAPRILDNELYSMFYYTPLKGFDYNGGDGTITRRDPSKVIFENGKYYMWYTYRNTPTEPLGYDKCNDTIPSMDWDLSEIWYATSTDGFTWEEQGVAVSLPKAPNVGHRSLSTTDILKWKGKYYLYYQAFNEPSGKPFNGDNKSAAGDRCVVSMAWANSPDGPWTHSNKIMIDYGAEDEWDALVVHDPFPLVHDGKIYIYYKAGFGGRDANGHYMACWGVAIADSPEGPFVKHAKNPVTNSGHEVILFPYKKGVAAIINRDGLEHNTIQYAEDWINFEIQSVVTFPPWAASPYSPDAFTDTDNADGITWGVCHFINAGDDWQKNYTEIARFDCDLAQSVNDLTMKEMYRILSKNMYYSFGLNEAQKERITKTNEEVINKNQ